MSARVRDTLYERRGEQTGRETLMRDGAEHTGVRLCTAHCDQEVREWVSTKVRETLHEGWGRVQSILYFAIRKRWV